MKIKPSTFPPQIPWGLLSSWLQVAGRQPQQAGLPRGMMVRVSVHAERLLVSPRRLIGIQGSLLHHRTPAAASSIAVGHPNGDGAVQ